MQSFVEEWIGRPVNTLVCAELAALVFLFIIAGGRKTWGNVFTKCLMALPQAVILLAAMYNAFRIRTHALTEYGMVIHEFDPWFNFRATQYLSKHGWHAFFHWYDYMSWYPLGRPVGTTIYPGLQLLAVGIHRTLRWASKTFGMKGLAMTLNDVCCTLPCWGGACATLLVALIAYECTGSRTAAVLSAAIMAIIPAHAMRSVGGGYDNECIAISAMLLTFYFWVRSLRTERSWPMGLLTGVAYGFMVAAWGGFIFVLNLVALHAAVLAVVHFLSNDYSPNLHRAYTLFYVVGTALATCVPPVGMTPFKSLEQLAALVVFIGLQALWFVDRKRKQANNCKPLSGAGLTILLRVIVLTAAGLFAVFVLLSPTGYFGPLSSRVRGLFVKHTRTGNPLVDSVAEHQPANSDALWHYMHYGMYGWAVGTWVLLIAFLFGPKQYTASISFLVVWSLVVYYFALRMSRLILLTAPLASVFTGMLLGVPLDWAVDQFFAPGTGAGQKPSSSTEGAAEGATKKDDNKKAKATTSSRDPAREMVNSLTSMNAAIGTLYHSILPLRRVIAVVCIAAFVSLYASPFRGTFVKHSEDMAYSFSNPRIMLKARAGNGQMVIIDDYREAYFWLRDKTPQDSRVMAWWDYGYQITGIGNRTSIADGNTWNHEHIATLGKCLTSPVKEAHSLIRHLADYVLIWTGGGGDDLAKSPHMARIGNSVYRDICKDDPLCSHFGFHDREQMKPTPMMKASLLYNLAAHGTNPAVKLNTSLFQLVKSTKYGKVKIYQVLNVSEESKAWLADPANRKCDAPGSWYCDGQYPPAPEIQALLAKRRDFGQLEDFNKKKKDDAYHQSYMRRMGAH